MNEDLDGNGSQQVERTQQVTGRFSIKPVDDVSFTEHDERLQTDTGQRPKVRGQATNFYLLMMFSFTGCEETKVLKQPEWF